MPGNDVGSGQASFDGLEYDLSQADLNYNIVERTTLPKYIISFDCAGGSTVEPIEAEVGSSVEAPPVPTRTNYVFTGWTYNGEPVTWPLTMPGADITLVAQWEHKTATYTVYHYLQNVLGTGYNLSEEDTQQITANVGTNISAVPLSVDGFTYYADYSTSTGMVTEDNSLELHLYYTRNTYTISFDADGGNVVNPITQVYGSTVELPTTEKIGHTFVGWELNDVPYTLTTMPLGGASLKAIWSVTQYKMEFYINNVKDESLTIIQNYNSVVIAPSISPPDGYEFSGWSPEVPERMPAGDTQYYATLTSQGFKINYYVNNELERTDSYQAGETIEPLNYECPYGYEFSGWSPSLPDVMPDYDINVYGTCSLKRVTVIFYLDGMEYDKITAQYGRPLEAPEIYVPDGYDFSGWSPEVPETMPAENMEFYGSLSVIEYTINFYLNGELKKTVTGPAGTLIEPPSVEEEGYSFSGWLPVAPLVMPTENMDVYGTLTILSYTVKFILDDETIYSEELEYGTPITSPEVEVPIGYSFSGWSPSVDATVPARHVTYTATLTANNYTITFYLNGEYYSAVTLPYGAAIAPIEVSVPDGYVFNGWSPEVPATMPAQNMNIYGTLSENTVTVSFDLNGGTGTVPAQIAEVIGTQIALPAQGDITREGYNFLGWATTPDATEALESFVIPSQEQTLYAVWQLAELPELIAVEGTDTIVDHERNIIYGFTQGVNESSIFDYIGSLGNTRIELEYTFNIGTGTEVRLIDNATNEVLKTYYIVIFGDIDGDGRITSLDCSALLNVVSYNADISYDSPYYYAADIDGWSGISSIDASNLLNVVSFNADIDQTTGTVEI